MKVQYQIITTFNQRGLEQYGQRMINSFEAHWPSDVSLIIYAEDCEPQIHCANVQVIDSLKANEDLTKFILRHQNNPRAHGKDGPPEVFDPRKTFRWDAVRFSHKVFSIAHAAALLNSGWLIWLDADTYSHSTLSSSTLSMLCPDNYMISYLGRGEAYHSECGWVGYNLSHPQCKTFIQKFVDMYRNDEIFTLSEWHDSFVWDHVRRQFNQNQFFNLAAKLKNTKGSAGHPFINSELGRYMDHAKGARKQTGYSKSTDIHQHHDLPYWQKILLKSQ